MEENKIKKLLDGFEDYLEEKRTLTRQEALVDYILWLRKLYENCKDEEFKNTLEQIVNFISNTKSSYYADFKENK